MFNDKLIKEAALDYLRHKPFSMEQFHEKFAELIVNDCLNVLCEEMYKLGIDLSNLPKFYKAMENTKKHFGVEE